MPETNGTVVCFTPENEWDEYHNYYLVVTGHRLTNCRFFDLQCSLLINSLVKIVPSLIPITTVVVKWQTQQQKKLQL